MWGAFIQEKQLTFRKNSEFRSILTCSSPIPCSDYQQSTSMGKSSSLTTPEGEEKSSSLTTPLEGEEHSPQTVII